MAYSLYLVVLIALLGPLSYTGVISNDDGDYKVGIGIADVTGPVADINMMGYANPSQSARGLHFRLFSRAFIFQSDAETPVVFVSADIAMMDQGLKFTVVDKLKEKYGETLFTEKNVLLSGTHTHSGPAAYHQYLLYGITSLGFNNASFNAIVDGIVQSIDRAYANLQPGRLFINKGRLLDANINRSPTSYLENPQAERDEYAADGDTDKTMTLVRIEDMDGNPLGSINWFAVHPVSMNNTNRLISGDNKGYASMLFEYAMNPDSRPGKGDFVAAFASTNLGDVSPNTAGPRCIDTGLPCDDKASTCGGFVQNCIAFGPGRDMEESTKIIGERQFEKAYSLFQDKAGSEQIKGRTGFIHQYINMVNRYLDDGKSRTCAPALGFSFAAGTTDGPGMFDFKQGDTDEKHPIWDIIRGFIKTPSPDLLECHKPKPILLAVGEITKPFPWVADTVITQIIRIGNLYLIGVPGELTTMSGRRVRKAVTEAIRNINPGGPEPHVVIAGLSNVYTHYIATKEEYDVQRYEAASTLYGPHTLQAYVEQYPKLATALLNGVELEDGPEPPNLLPKARGLSLIAPVVMDSAPMLTTFGQTLVDAVPEVNPGETITVQFVGGHPRNNVQREGTFFLVEKDEGTARWKTVATDADWSTKFRWNRPKLLSSESVITISWEVPRDAEMGFYRIRHFGFYKPGMFVQARSYQGLTSVFRVNGSGSHKLAHPEWSPNQKKSVNIRSPTEFWRALSFAVHKDKNE